MSTEHVEPQIDQVTLPGEILKAAREAKGLTIEEMSAISNLTKQVIRGIEANAYDDLAGLSFVRGYLKLYAKKLGVDETTVLEPFDAWKRAEQGESVGDQKPRGFDSNASKESEMGAPSMRWYAIGGVVLVALLATGVVISTQDSTEIEPEIAPRVDAPEEIVRPALTERDESALDSEIDRGEEVQLSDGGQITDDLVPTEEPTVDASELESSDEPAETVAASTSEAESPPPTAEATPVETTEPTPVVAEPEAIDQVVSTDSEVVQESPAQTPVEPASSVASAAPERTDTPTDNPPVASTTPAEPPSVDEPSQVREEPPVRQPVSQGRVIAEAANLEAPSIDPVAPAMEGSPADDGLRVLSETVTGSNAADQAMGDRGLLEMRFTGESWVEVRDARGRLVVADLMEAGRFVSLQTFGPIEVLVGAVSDSTVIFNGETLDLSGRSYQNVARVTLGAETN